MHRISEKNAQYLGANNRSSLYDLTIPKNWNKRLIIFNHGYMGYKDWGAWYLMEDFFLQKGFGFLKFNISHNGGTVENGIDFPDLEAFSENRYSYELKDMNAIIALALEKVKDSEEIYLVGHSRGGGMVLLQSWHPAITKIAALAPISDIGKRFPSGEQLDNWKSEGVRYTTNGRTKQQMPHKYLQYEDFHQHKERLDIESYSRDPKIPICVIHGEDDPSVKIEEGEAIAKWAEVDLIRIPNEQHTFGAKHPWTEKELPLGLQKVCEHLLAFFQ
ncbi:MAG: alpha/beta hydrolase family protein [Crocinitomicaceae bacterium]